MNPTLRIDLPVGVAYGSDLDIVETVSLDALKHAPGLVNEPQLPFIRYDAFGSSSIDPIIHFWIDVTKIHPNEARDEAIKLIKKAYDKNGIEIPFPIRTVYMEKS